jgi:3-hydroxymyristoyl/3-hydroxydecanoyl-(acyl carrier protein) dehydratase
MLLTHLAAHFDEVVLPRKLRVFPQLPRTKTGKIVRADLLALLSADPKKTAVNNPFPKLQQSLEQAGFVQLVTTEPQTEELGERVAVELSTTSEQLWFQGHFPHVPILPGVVQLRSLVLKVAQLFWPDLGELASLSRVKFKRPILPGDRLRVTLSRNTAKGTVSFSISWLENSEATESPLRAMLPQVFDIPAPAEASSGLLTFKRAS